MKTKRFLSIVLTLAMLVGMFPGMSLTASAADTTTTITSPATTGTMTITLTIAEATHSVTIIAGNNMTKTTDSGAASQTGLSGAMTPVVYTANEGYYFPGNYSVTAVNGISVTRNSYTQITVSGTPNGNAEITLTAPTAKTTPAAPTTATATDCTTADNNNGTLTGVTTAMEYKKSDAADWTAGTGSDITGLVPGTYYVRVKATDTTNASANQTLTIAAYQKEAAVVTKTPTEKTLTYNGQAQELVNAGTANGGTMQYALGTDDKTAPTSGWDTSIPTATEVGTYYVWYKAKGNDTHSDSTPACVTVTIAPSTPAPIPVTPDPEPTPTSDPTPAPDPTPTPAPAEQVTIPVENETSIQVTADVADGNARIGEIHEEDIAKVTGSEGSQAQNTDDTAIVIDVSGAQQEVKSVEISSTTLQLLAETAASSDNKIDKVEIKLTNASVVLDAATLQAISSQAQGDNIRLVVDDTNVQTLTASQQETLSQLNTVQTFEAYFESNGVRIGDFKGGTAEVSMPFTPEPGKDISHYFLVYVAEDGTITRCATVITTDSLVSILPHFSDYAIIYDESLTNDTEIMDKTWQNYSSVEAELCIQTRGDTQGTALVTTTAQGTAIIDQILTTGTDKTLVIDQVYYHGQYYKVQGIAAAAAKGNKEIRTLKVGKDVEKIGKKAFAGCKNLKKVKLTASAKNLKIGKNAFKRTANGITFKKGLKLSDKTRNAILESNSTAIFK